MPGTIVATTSTMVKIMARRAARQRNDPNCKMTCIEQIADDAGNQRSKNATQIDAAIHGTREWNRIIAKVFTRRSRIEVREGWARSKHRTYKTIIRNDFQIRKVSPGGINRFGILSDFGCRCDGGSDDNGMSYDNLTKWAFIVAIGIVDLVLLAFCPIAIQWDELILPACLAVLLILLSIYYHQRDGESLVLCMVSLLQLGAFSTVASLLVYEVTSLNFPSADPLLQQLDGYLGFTPHGIVQWARDYPAVNEFSVWAYMFIVPETMLTIFAISFVRQRILLEQFCFQFMLGVAICCVTGCFLPAGGPAYLNGITPAGWQSMYIEHFEGLRSGETFLFSWRQTEGLITFPSFHTAWAIMLVIVWRQQTLLLSIPVTIISVLIILSTLTTASHYLVDLFGGGVLAAFCAWASFRFTALVYHADGTPKRILFGEFSKASNWWHRPSLRT